MTIELNRPSDFNGDINKLSEWVWKQLTLLEAGFNQGRDFITLNVWHEMPSKLYEGLVVIADGTDWNPGAGAGLYMYSNSAWGKFGIATTFAQTILASANAAAARSVLGVGQLVALIEEQQASGTGGGTFTTGAERIRVLNTLSYNRDSIVTLASNQFTLPAGTWAIKWTAPAFYVDRHKSVLRKPADAGFGMFGTSEYSPTTLTNVAATRSNGYSVVSLGTATAFEIRHSCQTTFATSGFGVASSLGAEVYTQVEIYSL